MFSSGMKRSSNDLPGSKDKPMLLHSGKTMHTIAFELAASSEVIIFKAA